MPRLSLKSLYNDGVMDIEEFQKVIGVHFLNPALLQQSLTHRSYLNEQSNDWLEDNERLEYLGDAILDFITADMLYRRYPDMAEGMMTRLRSALVRTDSLAQLAVECRIGEVILMGKGEENSGGRERANNLCRAFEAVIGAIYLDRGLDAVRDFIIPRLTILQKDVMDEAIHKDARSRFQEWSQAAYNITPEYQLVSATGPEHKKEFVVEVVVGETVVSKGKGKTKQSAGQSAARAALNLVKKDKLTIVSEMADALDTVEVELAEDEIPYDEGANIESE